MYLPKYFEKHSKRTYIELFSLKENRINDDIMIPLSVPKEIDIHRIHKIFRITYRTRNFGLYRSLCFLILTKYLSCLVNQSSPFSLSCLGISLLALA